MRTFLIVLLIGMALSAAIGGFDLAFNGARWMKLPTEFLTGFDSFILPGIILLFVVGGTNLLAAIAFIKKNALAETYSMVAGLGLMIWFFTELYLFRDTHPIQIVYFVWSILIVALTFAMQRNQSLSRLN